MAHLVKEKKVGLGPGRKAFDFVLREIVIGWPQIGDIEGVKYRGYPTTCSATTGGMRYGLRDYAQYESAAMAAFLAEWTPKLKGGLQLTMCEDSLDMPPWEARIPISGK